MRQTSETHPPGQTLMVTTFIHGSSNPLRSAVSDVIDEPPDHAPRHDAGGGAQTRLG